MFDTVVAQHEGKDLVFKLDEHDHFWFIIRHSISQAHIEAVAFDAGYDIPTTYGGDVNAFFDQAVLPQSTQKVKEYFGKDTTVPIDTDDWRTVLKTLVRNDTLFDSNTVEFKRK